MTPPFSIKHVIPCLCIATLIASFVSAKIIRPAEAADKLKPEEILSKHLESLGTAQARAAVRTRMAVGTSKFTYHARGTGSGEGQAVLASEGIKNFIGMKFQEGFPRETFAFDGKRLTTSYTTPGVRTVLGDFLANADIPVKEGLLGGTLSSAWPLLEMDSKRAKLESGGTKKVNGVETYVLNYNPRKSSDFTIRLFFNSTTFQHIRTEYERVMSATIGRTPESSSQQTATRNKLVEEFSDFKPEGGLVLPHTYTIRLTLSNQYNGAEYEWIMNLTQFAFNQPLDPGTFDLDSGK